MLLKAWNVLALDPQKVIQANQEYINKSIDSGKITKADPGRWETLISLS